MTLTKDPLARVAMLIDAIPEEIYTAFTEPEWLTRFWLAKASATLRVGQMVEWSFMVAGPKANVTATWLDPDKQIIWNWPDGSSVSIDLEQLEDGTAITLVSGGFGGSYEEQVAAALDATEGFSIVLCDLKTLLESGKSAGLTAAKARLIEARR